MTVLLRCNPYAKTLRGQEHHYTFDGSITVVFHGYRLP